MWHVNVEIGMEPFSFTAAIYPLLLVGHKVPFAVKPPTRCQGLCNINGGGLQEETEVFMETGGRSR